ncbi:MAG: flagellar motor switch protein FliN [Lawsonibacter sp.]
MDAKIFSAMEIDAIGEIMNISLGSSATAVSNMLDHRVDITTPTVSIVDAEDFVLGGLDPAIGVEIKYVSGLEGSNIMLLKLNDVKVIVDILMGTETPEEEFELNDLTLSAVCEVMNQMMGAASTALSDFLGRMVNISTPQSFDVSDLDALKKEHLPVSSGPIVVVHFALSIENTLQSEFINVMSVNLAKELVAGFDLDDSVEVAASAADKPNSASSEGGSLSQEQIEALLASIVDEPEPASAGQSQKEVSPQAGPESTVGKQIEVPPQSSPVQTPPPPPFAPQPAGPASTPPGSVPPPYYPPYPAPDGSVTMPYGYYMPPPGWAGYAPPAPPPEPKVISSQPLAMPKLDNGEPLKQEQSQNLELIMNVPLEISVEIGRTRKKVQDILSFSKGSLVLLDKLAGDQVDLYANGKCIARGDVVVIDDNFGIRISEILRKPDIEDIS